MYISKGLGGIVGTAEIELEVRMELDWESELDRNVLVTETEIFEGRGKVLLKSFTQTFHQHPYCCIHQMEYTRPWPLHSSQCDS